MTATRAAERREQPGAVSGTLLPRLALWSLVALLAFIGFAASVLRAYGVLESVVFSRGAPSELSRLDQASSPFVAELIGMDRESDAYREIEEQNRRFLGKFNRYPATTLLHVVPAALLVMFAPLQFVERIRARHTGWHRWSGRLIVAMAIPVGMSGLFFGLRMPFAGAVEAVAIALFGCLFLFSLARAFVAIRRHDVATHRIWMIRMFGVVMGVAVVRIVGVVLALLTRAGPEVWFGPSVWIGFGSTAAVAELWIRLSTAGALLPGAATRA